MISRTDYQISPNFPVISSRKAFSEIPAVALLELHLWRPALQSLPVKKLIPPDTFSRTVLRDFQVQNEKFISGTKNT